MGRLKTIKESSPEWFKMSLFDAVVLMDPSSSKKYVKMILNLVSERMDEEKHRYEMNNELSYVTENVHRFISDKTVIESMDFQTKLAVIRLFDMTAMGRDEYREIHDFIQRHMNNKFHDVDVNKIETMDSLKKLNSRASISELNKELEKQVDVLMNNDTWLVVRPITYEASCKYGAQTRWCTTSSDSPNHFFRYTQNGKLVYILNKETGQKTALFEGRSPQNDNYEISFWNERDDRIDSMMTPLDQSVLDLIRNLIKNDSSTNEQLNPKMWDKSRTESLNGIEKIQDALRSLDFGELRTVRAIEEVEEEMYGLAEGMITESESDSEYEMFAPVRQELNTEVAHEIRQMVYSDHMDNRPYRELRIEE